MNQTDCKINSNGMYKYILKLKKCSVEYAMG